MSRLIDADKLKQAICVDYYEHYTKYHDTDQNQLIDMVIDDIDELPTVDAVEVVRCKDCEHYCDGTWCYINEDYFEEDDFCSYGERKENRG